MDALLLGLSTGTVCITYCGPVIVPFLLSEGKTSKRNVSAVLLFLGARLFGYMMIGLMAGLIGSSIFESALFKKSFIGATYVILSITLLVYAFAKVKHACGGKKNRWITDTLGKRYPWMVPAVGGLVTGLNFCPPFLLAITQAASEETIIGSVLFFIIFFFGTAVYFVPLPFLGFFRRKEVLQYIGKFAAGITGIIFLYNGISLIF